MNKSRSQTLPTGTGGRRLGYLDSLRGIAAFCVLAQHFGWTWTWFGVHGPLSILLSVMADGSAAVSLFFVLSGFVLSRKYLENHDRPFSLVGHWASFCVTRILRIGLPFLFVLGMSAALRYWVYPHLCAPPSGGPGDIVWPLWSDGTTWHRLLGQAFLFRSDEIPHHLLPQDWTLTIELNISLLMPVLTLIAAQSLPALLMFALSTILFLRMECFLLHFVAGIAIAKYFWPIKRWMNNRRTIEKALLLCLGLFLYGYRGYQYLLPELFRIHGKESWIWYVTGLGSAILLAAAVSFSRMQERLNAKPLLFLGKISYSFYLLHNAVIVCVTPVVLRWLSGRGMIYPPALNLITFIITLCAVITASSLCYRYIEAPSIQFAHRINEYWSSHPSRRRVYTGEAVSRSQISTASPSGCGSVEELPNS